MFGKKKTNDTCPMIPYYEDHNEVISQIRNEIQLIEDVIAANPTDDTSELAKIGASLKQILQDIFKMQQLAYGLGISPELYTAMVTDATEFATSVQILGSVDCTDPFMAAVTYLNKKAQKSFKDRQKGGIALVSQKIPDSSPIVLKNTDGIYSITLGKDELAVTTKLGTIAEVRQQVAKHSGRNCTPFYDTVKSASVLFNVIESIAAHTAVAANDIISVEVNYSTTEAKGSKIKTIIASQGGKSITTEATLTGFVRDAGSNTALSLALTALADLDSVIRNLQKTIESTRLAKAYAEARATVIAAEEETAGATTIEETVTTDTPVTEETPTEPPPAEETPTDPPA